MPATTLIQLRRGTATAWTTANPVLAAGEPGFEIDTGKSKIGDGAAAWTALPYEHDDKALVGHTHSSSQITDSTVTGRSVLTAASAAAARTAIGAGTSSLALGNTSTTAMPGDKTFSFAEITGLIGTAQLPPLAINELYTVTSQAAQLALTAERGDMAIRTDIGETFVLAVDDPTVIGNWKQITAPGNVTSVAGRQGAVVLVKSDVGLSNVDNTSDASKPVSTAQAAAINAKENTIAAGTTAQYYRGDKTWQTLNAAAVGLSAVNNTSDASKPVSTAQAAAIALKQDTIPVGTTAQFYRGDKTWATLNAAAVGLSAVNNTSDAAKPISTATQTALNGKANTAHTHGTSEITSIDGGTP